MQNVEKLSGMISGNGIESLSVEQCFLLMMGYRKNCFEDVASRLGIKGKQARLCKKQLASVMGD